MKRLVNFIMAAAVVVSLAACSQLDGLMSRNLFNGFADTRLTSQKIADMSAADLYLESQSPSFYDDLAADPELRDATLANVDAVLDSPTATEAQKQEAALVGASVMLETTQAAPLIDNILGLLTSITGDVSTEGSPMDNAVSLMEAILPANPDGSPLSKSDFTAMINALVDADSYYDQLGAALDPDAGYTDPAMNAGEIAQNALVAAIVSSVEPPAGTDLGTYLYDLLNPEPGAPLPEAPGLVMPDVTDGSPLGNLLGAAGMGGLADLLDPAAVETPAK